ncbi:MAG: hypothetical protein IPP18_14660 [Rhodocyclaceae bacterium]|nr:hypothetical protein [Rhodocyclaceae bacterium]
MYLALIFLLEGAMLGRNRGQQFLDGLLLRERTTAHQVDAERLPADALAYPLDVGGDMIRHVQGFAEHGKATGIDHGDGDIFAVGESDDGYSMPNLSHNGVCRGPLAKDSFWKDGVAREAI